MHVGSCVDTSQLLEDISRKKKKLVEDKVLALSVISSIIFLCLQDVLWQAVKVSVASLFAYVPVVSYRDMKFKSLLVFCSMTQIGRAHV